MRVAWPPLLAACLLLGAVGDGEEVTPMEQVRNLLQKLKERVDKETEVESESYQEFERWCDLEAQQCKNDISTAEGKIEEGEADINEAAAGEQRKKFDIERLAAEISHKEADLQKDTQRRAEDRAEFLDAHAKLQESIDTLDKAMAILSKVTTKEALNQVAQMVSFAVQRSSARTAAAPADRLQAFFQQVAAAARPAEASQRTLLQQPQAPAYQSEHSEQVKRVVQDTLDDIKGEQKKIEAEEQAEQHDFELLDQAMKTELASLKRTMDNTKTALAELQEHQAELEVDLADANKYHDEKTTYLQDITLSCQEKKEEFEVRSKSRVEEGNAIEEAMNILSSDRAKEVEQRRHAALEQDGSSSSQSRSADGLNFFQMTALTQRAVQAMRNDPFGKVKKMIVQMVEKLLSEQAQEQEHKAWCDSETAKTKKQKNYHLRQKEKFGSRVESMSAEVEQLAAQIKDASADSQEMQKALAEATEIRAKEKATAAAALKDYADAQQMLQKALQVLNEFYRKKAAASFLQQRAGAKLVAAPPPTFSGTDPSAARQDAAQGVLSILEIALSDFTKLESETQAEEAAAEKDFMQYSAENRQGIALAEQDMQHFTEEKGRIERELEAAKKDHGEADTELVAAQGYLEKLAEDCDFRGPGFEEQQARRESELKSLQNALAIISGEAIP